MRVESGPGRARGRVGSRLGHRTELGRKWIFFFGHGYVVRKGLSAN